MKLLIFLSASVFLLFCFSAPVFSQSCICTYDPGRRICNLTQDCPINSNTHAICDCDPLHNGGLTPCTCVPNPTTPPNQPTPPPACGTQSLPCCISPNPPCQIGLYCANTQAGNRCLTVTQCQQLPGGCPVNLPTSGPGKYSCIPLGASDYVGVKTAVGCLDVFSANTGPIGPLTTLSAQISAGIALLLIAYAAIVLVVSGGDPKKAQAAREIITAVLGGLVVIALSIVILNFLGVTILGLGPIGFRIN